MGNPPPPLQGQHAAESAVPGGLHQAGEGGPAADLPQVPLLRPLPRGQAPTLQRVWAQAGAL